ncbi:MAG: choice-of-anchor B family protein [Gemmatimonadota bacterium]|nr:choice-of-anchor B family protein [Gemmatimonadota bacterium]
MKIHRRPSLATLSAIIALPLLAAPAYAPFGGLHGQQYGGNVAVGNGQVLVGEASAAALPGVVYVYGRAAGRWSEVARLSVSPVAGPPDGFGSSLDAGGDLAIVGAPRWEDGTGAAFVFRADGRGGWGEAARLGSGTPAEDARFGTAVALDGTVALVSAPGEEDGAGAVYLFAHDGSGWSQRGRFRPDGAGPGFGTRVALDRDLALVSTAPGPEAPVEVHALRLDAASGTFATLGPLTAPDEMTAGGFGSAIALQGGLALVGVPTADPGNGAVLTFSFDPGRGSWSRGATLVPFSDGLRSRFGSAIGFDGDVVWIGAPGAGEGSGSVYRFARDEAAGWTGATESPARGLAANASYGSSLAVGGDVAVVGAGGIDERAGGVVIAERSGGSQWSGGELVIGEHRGLPAITGLDEEIPCVESDAAGYECDNVNIISFLPIKDLAGGRGARVNDLWGWTDPETGREIAIVGRSDGTAFVDLTDPHNPILLGNLPKTPGSRSAIWRDMKVFADHAYIVADGAGEHGVQVFDLRRLRDVSGEPVTFEPDFHYDGIASAHNIVINPETPFAYVVGASGGGETCGGGLHMLDLSEPASPVFAGCFADTNTGRRGTGYSHDAQCVVYHGPDEEYRGREICLGSNENALSIADVTDKDNPVAISFETYPDAVYAHQGWLTDDHRFFYMNDEGDEPQGRVEGTRTLIWDLEDLDEPILAAQYIAETPDTDHNLYILGNLMYQSNYGAGLRILDITEPTNPVEIAFFDNSPYGGASWSNYPYFKSGVVVMTSTGDGLFIVRNTGRRALIP